MAAIGVEERLERGLEAVAGRPRPLDGAAVRRRAEALRARRRSVRVVAAITIGMSSGAAALAIVERAPEPTLRSTTAAPDETISSAARLLDAVRADDAAEVERLLAAGADPNRSERHGMTPLLVASFRGNVEIAAAVHDAGGTLGARTHGGEPAVVLAARHGHVDMVRWLVERGADPDGRELASGRTALMRAAALGDVAMTRSLVELGADPAQRDADGRSALHHALDGPEPAAVVVAVSGVDPRRADVLVALLEASDPCRARSPQRCLWS